MLSEKLRTLRRQHGLSQEQLAAALHVSRQAVSKWESGTSVPESDTLIALSRYYRISLDELLTGQAPQAATPQTDQHPKPFVRAGSFLCAAGALGLVFWGVLFLFAPAASDRLAASSAITLDGSSLLLLGCMGALAAGAVLLAKQNR